VALKIGDEVTVARFNGKIVRAFVSQIEDLLFEWRDAKSGGIRLIEEEDIDWARGHDTPAARALASAHGLDPVLPYKDGF
jgi:hypothetical protein